jgi:tryptophan-rich sensory protein
MKINYWKLITSIVIAQLAGVIGSVFTSSGVKTWYPELIKPAFNPPSWVFGPVWVTLFLMMGIALYIVWESKAKKKTGALTIFGIQLALNTAWSLLFFGLRSPLAAFIEIIFLWTAILATIITFYRISKTSAYLLLPYILWVSFAAVLNLSLFILN